MRTKQLDINFRRSRYFEFFVNPFYWTGALGGQIAQELCLLAPERVRSLVLANTWAKTDLYTASLFRLWHTLRDRLTDEIEFLRVMFVFGNGVSTLQAIGLEELARSFAEASKPQAVAAFHRNVDADLTADTLDRLSRIAKPSLVVWSQEDLTFPPRHAQQLREGIDGAEEVCLPGVGHNSMLQKPEAFNSAVLGFLARH